MEIAYLKDVNGVETVVPISQVERNVYTRVSVNCLTYELYVKIGDDKLVELIVAHYTDPDLRQRIRNKTSAEKNEFVVGYLTDKLSKDYPKLKVTVGKHVKSSVDNFVAFVELDGIAIILSK